MKQMEIDQDYLRTGTAVGSRASHEHCSTSCLKPNAVIAVQLELKKEMKFYSISIQPCSHMTTYH